MLLRACGPATMLLYLMPSCNAAGEEEVIFQAPFPAYIAHKPKSLITSRMSISYSEQTKAEDLSYPWVKAKNSIQNKQYKRARTCHTKQFWDLQAVL